MNDNSHTLSARKLANCIPINALTSENFLELVNKTRLERLAAGRKIFQTGDADNKTVYVLEGTVELRSNQGIQVITAGTQEARHPLGMQQPRQCTATAKTDVAIVRIDSNLLDLLLTWDQSSSVEVEEIDSDDGDWMSCLLQTQSFRSLPAANIQALFMKMEHFPVLAGEKIIHQGDEGDYYYMIIDGRCKVTRSSPRSENGILLAELGPGDAFGEEALISENKRNATVTMITDGTLIRLRKADFLELMEEPLQHHVSLKEAGKIVSKGGEMIDVRLPSEFSNDHIENSRNIPLFFLRNEADKLSRDKHYVMVCDTGRRSSAAAFILSEKGFDVSVLEGGIVKQDRAPSSAA